MTINILNGVIKKLVFQTKPIPEEVRDRELTLQISNDFNSGNSKKFTVNFYLKLHSQESEITIEATYFFETDKIITEDFKSSTFPIVNAPAIAFPFLRAFISNLTLQGGIQPINLPSINFVEAAKNHFIKTPRIEKTEKQEVVSHKKEKVTK